jgi:hypothetical protein
MENNLIFSSCPCCGFLTIKNIGHYEICPVCFWEDDPIQYIDHNYAGGANKVSLQIARKNYANYGASMEEYIEFSRPPKPEES